MFIDIIYLIIYNIYIYTNIFVYILHNITISSVYIF